MRRPTLLLLPSLVLLGLLTGCSGDPGPTAGGTASSTGTDAGDGSLTWGEGPYGVVLAHGAAFDAAGWEVQARAIADQGATVVAVADISPDGIAAAVGRLQDGGVADVALVGGSAGADAILQLASQRPDLPDQLVLLSPNTVVEGLGREPKLFVAGREEPVAEVSTQLARLAPGDENVAVLVPGSAHAQNVFGTDQGDRVLQLVLDRLARFS